VKSCAVCGAVDDQGSAWCQACGSPFSDGLSLRPGSFVANRYQVLDLVGRGGFSLTYRAMDTTLSRLVALKELFPETAVRVGETVTLPHTTQAELDGHRRSFLIEARTMAQFDHPNLVRVTDTLTDNNTAYLAMEYVDGETLEARLQRGPLTWEEHRHLVQEVCAGLSELHAANVLHRDIKPGNIMLRRNGRVVLLDFGAARTVNPAFTRTLTRIITPQYAAPEQRLSSARFGPSTDLFSLATVCYECATTQLPPSIDERLLTGASPHLSAQPNLTAPAAQTILEGLRLPPYERPTSAIEFATRFSAEPVAPQHQPTIHADPPPTELPRSTSEPIVREPTRGNPSKTVTRTLIACTAALLTLFAGLFVLTRGGDKAEPDKTIELATESSVAALPATDVTTSTVTTLEPTTSTSVPETTRPEISVASAALPENPPTIPILETRPSAAEIEMRPERCRRRYGSGTTPDIDTTPTVVSLRNTIRQECTVAPAIQLACSSGTSQLIPNGEQVAAKCVPDPSKSPTTSMSRADVLITVQGIPITPENIINNGGVFTNCDPTTGATCTYGTLTLTWNHFTEDRPKLTLNSKPKPTTTTATTPTAPTTPKTTPATQAKGSTKRRKTTTAFPSTATAIPIPLLEPLP
jgi:serine/threonine protein kinase